MLATSNDNVNIDNIVEQPGVLSLRYVATTQYDHQSSSVDGDKVGNDLDDLYHPPY